MKVTLPLVQVGLAFGLLLWDQAWQRAMPVQDMPELSPALKLLMSINAPLLVPAAFWLPRLSSPWNYILLVVAIGLFWYWVALNVVSWRERRTACMYPLVLLRLIGDVSPISVGAFLILICWQEISQNYLPIPWSEWVRFIPFGGPMIAWSMVLIIFFGWDLIHCVLPRKPGQTEAK